MKDQSGTDSYFPHDIQIPSHHWHSLDLGAISRRIKQRGIPPILFFRQLALKLNSLRPSGAALVHAGELNLYASLLKTFRFLIDEAARGSAPSVLLRAAEKGGVDLNGKELKKTSQRFIELFPPDEILFGSVDSPTWLAEVGVSQRRTHQLLREMLLLKLAAANPAIDSFRELVDDRALTASSRYEAIVGALNISLKDGPKLAGRTVTLIEELLAAIQASPGSLAGQIGYIREQWRGILPPEILQEVEIAIDIIMEEQRERGWGGGEPGPSPVLQFRHSALANGGGSDEPGGSSVFAGFDYPEFEQFSPDADWMSHVVLMAKMVYVWLDQLSRSHGYPITRLDQVPDAELDRLAAWGFTGLWLIGLWERSAASQRIKQICGNPDAIASAYSLYDYEVAADLGGWEALANLRERALKRGIRLASDMVPNHTGIYSRWVIQHPDWFVQTDYPPFPTYQYHGEDLSHDRNVCIQLEDGYWNKSDAAVVFKHYDRTDGRIRYIYHGNDGTSIPWNDTAQLNYLIPEVRESVIQTILHVARNFPIIRFDAAMTLAKKHYQRLWFPLRGLGGGIPSRAEHGMSKDEFDALFPVEFWREVVDRVAVEAPGTLLLAEAFWMMEGYFVRTLGMHRVYNSAFMNMLKTEENAKYRQTIRNVLEFNHEVLKRFVNFMNNPDEKTAVAQFGSQGKYFGACVLLATMPGLPMFGHGQIEGFHEKYGMEYKRAYWDEKVDQGLLRGHEMWIFPLLKKRWLFSGSENFALYDFHTGDGVDENVFAYSNRAGTQRALVLYHNCHATTAGWIRETVPCAVTAGEGGEPELQGSTLAAQLTLSSDDDMYLAFRDLTENLEYLRSVRELREKGLYVELGEYQFHVFMDFREISDDTDASWGHLHAHLNGAGVISLEDERKQLQYADLNSAFLALVALASAPDGAETPADDGTVFGTAFATFRQLLSLETTALSASPLTKKSTRKIARPEVNGKSSAVSSLAAFEKLLGQKPKTVDASAFRKRLAGSFSDRAAARLLLAESALRGSGVTTSVFGLDYTLQQLLHRENDSDFSRRGCLLLEGLLEWRSAGKPTAASLADLKSVAKLFRLPVCRRYLLVHESDEVEWFNKERFEELLEWTTLLGLLETISDKTSAAMFTTRMSAAECTIRDAIELAARLGYKSHLFLEVIGTPYTVLPGRPALRKV